MTSDTFTVGAYVLGAPTAPRALVRHEDLLQAYANGAVDDDREAYLSHFVFGSEMRDHYRASRNSVAGYAGPCWARFVVLDIDRPDIGAALADVRRLVQEIDRRYPECEGDVPVFFSGSKGFHVLVELAHKPPPAVGFNAVARTFAEAIAARAGVEIDRGIYDVNHLIRLPNTRHPRSGLFRRRISEEALMVLDPEGILESARYPDESGIPTIERKADAIAADWVEAERETARQAEARVAIRRDRGQADERAPRYLLDLPRFGVGEGERHATLFRAAAWLTEQGAPPSLAHALLFEAGCDVGLSPADAARQIACGISHAARQAAVAGEGGPDG